MKEDVAKHRILVTIFSLKNISVMVFPVVHIREKTESNFHFPLKVIAFFTFQTVKISFKKISELYFFIVNSFMICKIVLCGEQIKFIYRLFTD